MKKFTFTKRHRNVLLWATVAAAAVAGIYILAQLGFGIPCLFNRVTGLLCPGCGNTRAALALLRLDFAAAWGFNPLCFAEFFYIAWVLFFCTRAYLKDGHFGYKPPLPALDICLLALVVLWWPVRNLL